MSEGGSASGSTPSSRGRGRGKSRGGLGKYLRARGRGRGGGRPAEFSSRLLLEGEGKVALTEEEEEELRKELTAKYSRRQLGTNEDRYKDEEPELDSDGEPIVEPEVDISAFLDKQRSLDPQSTPLALTKEGDPDDEADVDHELAHITSQSLGLSKASTRKGKVETLEWNESLEEMSREKKAAEAKWELKDRFKAKSEKLRTKPTTPATTSRTKKSDYKEAPELPPSVDSQPKSELEHLEDFLDDLLT